MAEDFNELKKEMEGRGNTVVPPLPGANWIEIAGTFTPKELRAMANHIDAQFAEVIKNHGNSN